MKVVLFKHGRLPKELGFAYGKRKGINLFCYFDYESFYTQEFKDVPKKDDFKNYSDYIEARYSFEKINYENHYDFVLDYNFYNIKDLEYQQKKNLFRMDPDLVSLVENGSFEETKIVEVPNDIEWNVVESETGIEYIEEVHRTWWPWK